MAAGQTRARGVFVAAGSPAARGVLFACGTEPLPASPHPSLTRRNPRNGALGIVSYSK